MGIFDGIKGQRGTLGGVYFKEGHYVVLIDRVKSGRTRKDIDFFVAECTVKESSNSDMPAGKKPSFMVMLDKDAAMGNVSDFLRVGMWIKMRDEGLDDLPASYDLIDPDSDDAEECCGEDNPLAGIVMGLRAYVVETRAGNPFTRHQWMLPEEARENIAVAVAEQAAKKPATETAPAA
jgi:hypothetical protein